MGKVEWIKLHTGMFDDEKIKLISALPERDTLLVVWIRLMVLAGRTNDNGAIYLCEEIPYTDEMLATLFDRPLNVVRLAIETFERFGMIERHNGTIYLVNWEKYQNIKGLEDLREKERERQRRYRERHKLSSSLKEEDKEKEEDIDIESNVTRNVTPSRSPKRQPELILGECQNVRLTTAEYERLKAEHGQEVTDKAVDFLSMWKEEKGKRVKNDNLAIRRWAIDAAIEQMNRRGEGSHTDKLNAWAKEIGIS